MSENITVNMENLSDNEREQLLGLIEKSNKKKEMCRLGQPLLKEPKEGTEYWYITIHPLSDNLMDQEAIWRGNTVDKHHLFMFNVFCTKEDCEFAIEKLKVERELKLYADEYNDTESEDWNGDNRYYYMEANINNKGIFIKSASCLKPTNQIYFTSRYEATNAIQTIGEERIKKYYLEI